MCPLLKVSASGGFLRPPTLLTNWLQIRVVSVTPFKFINLLEQLTELRKTPYSYDYMYIIKDTIRRGQMKRHIGQGLGKSPKQSFHVPSPWNQDTSSSWHWCIYQLGSSAELQCPEFWLGFHYAGLEGYTVPQITWLVFLTSSLHPEPFHYHKLTYDPRRSWITKILLSLGKF